CVISIPFRRCTEYNGDEFPLSRVHREALLSGTMDLNDFGTDCNNSARSNQENPYYHPPGYYQHNGDVGTRPIQWKIQQAGVFEACGVTAQKLPAGAYGCVLN